jgi:hypothetical protein
MKWFTGYPEKPVFEVMDDRALEGGFAVIWRSPTGSVVRANEKILPPCLTKEEAEAKLETVAKMLGWKEAK